MDPSTAGSGSSPTIRITVGAGSANGSRDHGPSDDISGGERGRRLLNVALSAADEVDVREVGTTGIRALDPLVLLTRDGTTAFHPRPSVDRLRDLVAEFESGTVCADDAAWTVEHDSDRKELPTPGDGPLSVGRRRLLGRCGWADPERSSAADNGATAFVRDDAQAALSRVRDIAPLGRGRGDASQDDDIVTAWETVREASGDPVVVVNANESDRRNETDRTLLGGAPAEVLDGALAVARLVGAAPNDIVVYLNENDDFVRNRLQAAAESIADDLDVDPPKIVAGPDSYIAGEFTMALEALEGNDRLEARLRPPGPARHGVYGRPTVVHTPRTFAQVREAILRPDQFNPDDADPGTRLFSIAGDVESPATVELPTGGSLTAVDEAITMDGRFKMACVGGQFGGFTRSLDHSPSASGLASADLGTEGVIELLDESTCAVASAGKRASVASEENCGRCFPCREGSKQAVDLLRNIYDGEYEDAMLRELTRTMRESSICHFGRAAARSIGTAVNRFETEFEAHADGRCPSGTCDPSHP